MINGVSTNAASVPAGNAQAANDKQLREAAQDFEAMFVGILLKQMRASTRALSSEKASFARQTFEEWQDDMFAKNIAISGGLGVGEVLYRQLQKEQLDKAQIDK